MFLTIILAICGLVFVGAVFEIILPENANRKYLKGAISLVFCYVLITSVSVEFNIESVFSKAITIEDNQQFLDYMDNIRVEIVTLDMQKFLEEKGYANVTVSIKVEKKENLLLFEKIILDTKNMVIKQNIENIDISMKLLELICDEYEIDRAKVVVL